MASRYQRNALWSLNEQTRLQALLEFEILDTPAEESFDRITRLASQFMDVPMVLISLIDKDRQWFKSKVGIDAEQTSRDDAFCAHAILQPELMVVPAALKDVRFHDNPLVIGAPDIWLYAGAPLTIADNIRVGTLCAVDTKPRTLSPA